MLAAAAWASTARRSLTVMASVSMAQVTVAALPSGPPAEVGLVPMVWASPVQEEKAQAAAVQEKTPAVPLVSLVTTV